ncbi:GIY-YIG nuclease family protein [Sphingomonas alba]|uniref:GIY-YIG nuclease family protein n=1 Tax=Sphingomonas alba TaxID=2908208 RepID=A0ABT0RLD8_9SPHN|nr:GIY-YIG nuclease family protein [Sphingomonas alba]MCL6683453.1 GIY-YIG nuclease family protein [Sphingomonas alba]
MGGKEVNAAIERQIALAQAANQEGTWITYLMRDPRRPDLRGNPAGWPVYVGQTDEFGQRVRNHLRKSEKLARKGKGIKYRLKELLHAGVVPNFEVLDRQPTRLQSLLSETNYARLCRTRGYDIANQTTLQNKAGPPITKEDLPKKWLRQFTLEQAEQDGIEVEVVCCACGERAAVSVSAFLALPSSPKLLRDLQDDPQLVKGACVACGGENQRRITFRIP